MQLRIGRAISSVAHGLIDIGTCLRSGTSSCSEYLHTYCAQGRCRNNEKEVRDLNVENVILF